MDKPKSLASLFEKKIFRIPDYQRGYAWQENHLKDFWEDLINLPDDRSHYTGVLTLQKISPKNKDDNEYWLVEDHDYEMYHIVDGQQRLTTFIVFLQAFIDFIKKELNKDTDKSDREIYITDSLSLEAVISKYLYKTKPTGDQHRTYKFGYSNLVNNPSYKYLRHKIFNEDGSSSIEETFYTLNLRNAKLYFYQQLKEFYSESGMNGLPEIYKKLTKKFLFNQYVIRDDFDVFVAFETMNNRGKRLSNLERLKNRMIYLTTLYTKDDLEEKERKILETLRDTINKAWTKVYCQLGRNGKHQLNDDLFLKDHYITYCKRTKESDYIKYLLDERFSPQKIYKKVACEVAIEMPEVQLTDFEIDDTENENEATENKAIESEAEAGDKLQPSAIEHYANDLKESAVHWVNSWYPYSDNDLEDIEKNAIDRLNRIGMKYFRPLIMSVFKNKVFENKERSNPKERTKLLNRIERFIFIVFSLSRPQSNYKKSEFYRASHDFNFNKLTLEDIKGKDGKLDEAESRYFDENRKFNSTYFYDFLRVRFKDGSGYYDWHYLPYILYEYELNLRAQNEQEEVVGEGEDLLITPKDKISIEHIFPQTPAGNWKDFANVDENLYRGSIGNLLLLSKSINSSLGNNDFSEKKKILKEKGYLKSHSVIEVAKHDKWTPAHIRDRGLRLLNFMEKRWDIKFKDDATKESLLFLKKENGDNPD